MSKQSLLAEMNRIRKLKQTGGMSCVSGISQAELDEMLEANQKEWEAYLEKEENKRFEYQQEAEQADLRLLNDPRLKKAFKLQDDE